MAIVNKMALVLFLAVVPEHFVVAAQTVQDALEALKKQDSRNGRMRFLPARWTNLAAPDPFVITAAGRAWFRVEDLIRVQDRLKEWKG